MGDDEARVLTATRSVMDAAGVLPLRAGVNVGRVFAGDYGPSYAVGTYSITGDCVNLAARLMAKAEHGQIVATPEVLARSRTAFETDALPPFTVKGKTQPVHAVVVGSIIKSRTASTVRQPLIGRDQELKQLLGAALGLAEGQGRVVEVIGEAGMGKSRLVEEVVDTVGHPTLWADGDIYGTHTPYQPFHRLFASSLAQ